jgi:hypothetical protein
MPHYVFTPIAVPAEHCIGAGHADPGYLCIYMIRTTGSTMLVVAAEEGSPTEVGRFGFGLDSFVTTAGYVDVLGTYTVTAP